MTVLGFADLAAIRLGGGFSPRFAPPRNKAAVLDDLAATVALRPAVTTADADAMNRISRDINRLINQGELDRDAAKAMRDAQAAHAFAGFRRRLALGVAAPVGFGERLVQFWSDHFTIRPERAPGQAMGLAHVDEAIRPHIAGQFADLLRAAILHPSMVVFLDQQGSVGPNSPFARKQGDGKRGLNENLARELLELHSIGPDAGYGQEDVRQLAQLLTGLRHTIDRGLFFDPNWSEPGAVQILGRGYGGGRSGIGDIEALLDDLAHHPATARHIARKLATHFTADNPDADLIAAMTARFTDTDGNLAAVYEVMIDHPVLGAAFRAKARQPLDLMIAAFRALNVTEDRIMALNMKDTRRWLLWPLRAMGHDWGNPIGPDGLPEAAEAWITPQRLAARIDWAMQILPRLVDPLPKAPTLIETALRDTGSAALRDAVPRAETNAEGVGLILASVEFNRR